MYLLKDTPPQFNVYEIILMKYMVCIKIKRLSGTVILSIFQEKNCRITYNLMSAQPSFVVLKSGALFL